MCGGNEHQIARRPGVECAVRENAGHAKLCHLRNVVPTNQLPFVGQDRIDPGVVWLVANRVVVKIGNRLVQVVKHLRFPTGKNVEYVARKFE